MLVQESQQVFASNGSHMGVVQQFGGNLVQAARQGGT
jgi:hypothetical protein